MHTPHDSNLGQAVSYPSAYDPGLLFPIPRAAGRTSLGIDDGALPFVVFGLIWSINGEYMQNFFVDPRLMIAGGVGMVWMGIGAFIMAKMINFEI